MALWQAPYTVKAVRADDNDPTVAIVDLNNEEIGDFGFKLPIGDQPDVGAVLVLALNPEQAGP